MINASNLNLPVRNSSFDVIISIGVIHHTGNALKSFKELVRILKPKGRLYLAVYRKWGRYHLVYMSVGLILRLIYFKIPMGKFIIDSLVVSVFYLFDNIFFGRKRSYLKSRALFFDTFLHPIVTFHTENEIRFWSKKNKLKSYFYDFNYSDLIFTKLLKE